MHECKTFVATGVLAGDVALTCILFSYNLFKALVLWIYAVVKKISITQWNLSQDHLRNYKSILSCKILTFLRNSSFLCAMQTGSSRIFFYYKERIRLELKFAWEYLNSIWWRKKKCLIALTFSIFISHTWSSEAQAKPELSGGKCHSKCVLTSLPSCLMDESGLMRIKNQSQLLPDANWSLLSLSSSMQSSCCSHLIKKQSYIWSHV